MAIFALLMLIGFTPTFFGQQNPSVGGDYVGTLGTLHLTLHIRSGPNGTLNCTVDSPDQGAMGLPCADVHLNGKDLSFSVPSVHGTWKGTVGNGGAPLSGMWSQSHTLPLDFTRDTFSPAAKPSRVDGIWLGTLHAGTQSLRIQIEVKSDHAGHEFCSLDSLDQHAMGLPCKNVVFHGNDFSFDVPVVHGHWNGKLSADEKTLAGTWNQGNPLPLDLKKQAVAQRD